MQLSEIAAIIESSTRYAIIGIRQDRSYVLADLGVIDSTGYASPTFSFVVHQDQLVDHGPEYLRILTAETCEKLDRAIAACAKHA